MKNFVLAAAAVAVLTAGTASAQSNDNFLGVRGELHAGAADVRNARDVEELRYGVTVGVDAPLGDRFTLGVETEASNVFDNDGRELGVGARLGYAATDNVLLYGRAGYVNLDDARRHTLDGLALGAGAEWRLGERSFVSTEYRYTDFNQNVDSHGVRVGLGVRF